MILRSPADNECLGERFLASARNDNKEHASVISNEVRDLSLTVVAPSRRFFQRSRQVSNLSGYFAPFAFFAANSSSVAHRAGAGFLPYRRNKNRSRWGDQ